MEITHENLEKTLKIIMDKLKYSLGLEFRNQDYTIQLVDWLKSDYILAAGQVVTVKILTDRFTEAFDRDAIGLLKNKKKNYEFRQALEKCLRLVPRMLNNISHAPVADALVYNSEKEKFKKVKGKSAEITERTIEHDFEKGINYTLDYRATAIHWKSGLVIREHSNSLEAARRKARSKIVLLLQDPNIFNREEDNFMNIEPHEDIIYDTVIGAKILTKDEVIQLIKQLEKEYIVGK